MNTKSFKFEIKDLNDAGTFTGHASVYGNTDLGGDVVERGAFTKTIGERGSSVPILWQHDTAQPLGLGELKDIEHALEIKGALNLEVSRAREAYALLKQGALKGLSIGYSTVKDAWDTTAKVRRLQEVKLWEVSLVTIPMNPLAHVSAVKFSDLQAIAEEVKAGRSISASNRTVLEAAVSAIRALLDSVDQPDEEAAKSMGAPDPIHSAISDCLVFQSQFKGTSTWKIFSN